MKAHHIDIQPFTLSEFLHLLRSHEPVTLSVDARAKIEANHRYLERRINERDEAIYGVNTGFGSLCDTRIGKADLAQLQRNLVVSHACGAGAEVAPEIVRAMMLLKIQNIAIGCSGVAPDTVQLLMDLFNKDILPIIFERGSLGASGDLAPLAHMSLPLLGLGEVSSQGERMSAKEALDRAGLVPGRLGAKEGLALLNGTQFMSAHAAVAIERAERIARLADEVASVSADAYQCMDKPFDRFAS